MKKEIYSASSLIEADIIKSFLKSRGIECSIWDRNMASVYPGITLSSGIRLVVEEEDYLLAKEIMQEYLEEKKENT